MKKDLNSTIFTNQESFTKEISDLLELTRKTRAESTALLNQLTAVSEDANALGKNEIQLDAALLQQLNEFVFTAEKRCLHIKQHLDSIKSSLPLC